MAMARHDPGEKYRSLQALNLAWVMAACLLVGGGLGYLVDRWLGTTPWLMIAGLVLGIIAAFVELFRAAARIGK
jgi:ATP synthase protein I